MPVRASRLPARRESAVFVTRLIGRAKTREYSSPAPVASATASAAASARPAVDALLNCRSESLSSDPGESEETRTDPTLTVPT